MANHRYNIDTVNDDLIQIDIKDKWTVSPLMKAYFCVVKFDYPNSDICRIEVSYNDLVQLRDKLNHMLKMPGPAMQEYNKLYKEMQDNINHTKDNI